MIKRLLKSTFLFFLIGIVSCGNTNGEKAEDNSSEARVEKQEPKKIFLGAQQTDEYLPLLKGKNIAVVGNQTSVLPDKNGDFVHLVDSLLSRSINISKVFAPEHGFRGDADAGEKVSDGIDQKTNLPIISLYGDHKKPNSEDLKSIDILLFDIQDVGARFYTYISTLHYIMEAAAENSVKVIVLDRPNPNGSYIDGPVLEKEHSSFVGLHPVPIVYGMTIGEYAQMVNGEKWLKNGIQADLQVIKLKNYNHNSEYHLPVKPSPNLPNDQSINLYPSLCFFEGTNVNAGRGTNRQFQVFGSPFLNKDVFNFSYTPEPMPGAAYPKHSGKKCYGMNLTKHAKLHEIELSWLINAYQNTLEKSEFFNNFFTKLAGTTKLQKQIEDGISEEEIKKSWEPGLSDFKGIRKKYLIY